MAVLAVIRLKAQGLPWTELMDAAMVAVHSQQGRTGADIKAACGRVPMHHRMHEVCPVTHIRSVTFSASWAAWQRNPKFACWCKRVFVATLSVSGACRTACVFFPTACCSRDRISHAT